jgi:hypoxanthine phosphoribosyltransferase
MIDTINDVESIKARATLLYSCEEINTVIDRIAKEMNEVLAGTNPLMLVVMNGAVIFAGHLATRLTFNTQFDYVHATRYRGEIEASELHWLSKPHTPMAGRTVVIIEDILDTGVTLAAVADHCKQENAKTIYTAALIDKDHPRTNGGIQKTDFTGLKLEDKFLFGFGLDYKGFLRNEPGIFAVE